MEPTLTDYIQNFLLDTIPDELDAKDEIIYKLLETQANDANSSTFREMTTLRMSNYNPVSGKLGYDGTVPDTNRPIEVKPMNTYTNSKSKQINKLNGRGNFSDFTHKRLEKYKEDDVLMVVSGYYDGKLKFIVEFDYRSANFYKQLSERVTKALPEGDKKGKYCRSAGFSWKHWKDANNLRLIYRSEKIDSTMMTRDFLKFIKSL